MARQKFKDLVATKKKQSTGGSEGKGNFFKIEDLKFDSSRGEDKRNIVLPVDEDNEVILWEQPYHAIKAGNKTPNGRGIVELPKRDGGSFTPFEFGCTHYVTERDADASKQLKEDNHVCVLCDVYNHESRKVWAEINEAYPNFREKTGKEKREIFTKVEDDVRTLDRAWEFVKDEDGSNELRVKKHNKVLVAEVAEDGSFELKLWKLSDSRLKKLNEVLAESVDTGVFPEEHTSVLSDEDGEVIYNIGGVQFMVKYPKNSNKAQAGRDATFAVLAPSKSQVIQDESLMEKINEEARSIIDKVNGVVENDYALRPRSEEEVLELLDVEYYNELKEQYPPKDYSKDSEESDDSKEKEEKPKKRRSTRKKKEEVNEQEEEQDIDDLFGE